MASSSSDSEEFYDAVYELPSRKSLSLLGFLQPAVANILPSPRKLAAKARQLSLSPKHSPVSEKLPGEESPISRHNRLKNLRNKMVDEFEGGPIGLLDESDQAPCSSAGLSYPPSEVHQQPDIESLSTSDISSLASWGKNLLTRNRHQFSDAEPPIVTAIDSMSTKACFLSELSKNVKTTSEKPKNLENTPISPTALEPELAPKEIKITGSLVPSINSKPVAIVSLPTSINNSSSGSSKNSTIDRFGASLIKLASTKTSSLDRRVPASSGNRACSSVAGLLAAKKSSSLTREVGCLSACATDRFVYEDAQLAAVLHRKNSAATELIESLTNAFVARNAALVATTSDSVTSSVASSQLVKSASAGDEAPGTPGSKMTPHAASSGGGGSLASGIARISRAIANATPTLRANVGKAEAEAPTASVRPEPDIVASNRIKEAYMLANIASSSHEGAAIEIELPPPKPPRRKKHQRDVSFPVPQYPTRENKFSTMSLSANVSPTSIGAHTFPSFHGSLLRKETEALKSTFIKNLDTGEQFSLTQAEDKLPKCDPLSLHMMKLNNDLKIRSLSHESDNDSFTDDLMSMSSLGSKKNYFAQARLRTLQYKKFIGRSIGRAMNKTVRKIRNVAEGVRYHFHTDETNPSEEDDNSDNSKMIRVRASHKHKGPYDFEQIRLAQNLTGEHAGSVWCLKFSHCGRLLATGGQDNLIRVWVLKDAFNYFNDMRSRYNVDEALPFYEQLQKCTAGVSAQAANESCRSSVSGEPAPSDMASVSSSIGQDDSSAPFVSKPFGVYRGHSSDVLDLSWSKNYFLLSSSMDRTVRLWHISRTECLCCFQHIDFVTAIVFLPKDDRYFLSGSLDGKLRLWYIPEKKVALWNEVEGGKLVTTLTFARNGKFAVVGTYDGRCIFYSTDQLKYHTQIDVKSGHGKNSRPHKITGLESFQDKLLVTTNDSRIRLYDLRDLSLSCKYKGYTNYSSQIRATFSHNGKYIICGSEDKNIYIWKTTVESDMLSLPPVRKDRNRMWESIRAHSAVVTAAIFAPKPELIFQQIQMARRRPTAIAENASTATNIRRTLANTVAQHRQSLPATASSHLAISGAQAGGISGGGSSGTLNGEVLVSADFGGSIYVFINRAKLKTGASTFLVND